MFAFQLVLQPNGSKCDESLLSQIKAGDDHCALVSQHKEIKSNKLWMKEAGDSD